LLGAEALSARVVVGPAGYNLTYELSALGVWHLALPASRQYDNQELRAERVATVAHAPVAVERRIHAWLDQAALRPRGDVRAMRQLASALSG
jgi:predicted glycosyltransferase